MFAHQLANFQLWYRGWKDVHVSSSVQEECDKWYLGTTGEKPISSKRYTEEYNGQKRFRYTTE